MNTFALPDCTHPLRPLFLSESFCGPFNSAGVNGFGWGEIRLEDNCRVVFYRDTRCQQLLQPIDVVDDECLQINPRGLNQAKSVNVFCS